MVPVNLLGRTLVVSWFPEGVRPCATWNSSCIQLSCLAFHLLTALSPISLIQLEHKRTERIKWSLPHPLNISIYSSPAHHSQPRPNLTETKEHFNQSHSVLKFILPVLQETPSSKMSLTAKHMYQLCSSKPPIPIFLYFHFSSSQKQRARTRVAEHSVIAVVRHGGRTASALQAHVVPRSNPSPWSPSSTLPTTSRDLLQLPRRPPSLHVLSPTPTRCPPPNSRPNRLTCRPQKSTSATGKERVKVHSKTIVSSLLL